MERKASKVSNLTLLFACYVFASPTNLFRYFRRRFSDQLIQDLNHALKLKARCISSQENVRFIRKCLTWYVTPEAIRQRVRRSRPKSPIGIERAFVKDEISKDSEHLEYASREFRRLLAKVSRELSFFDWLRFCKFINKTSSRKREQLALKKEKTFKWLNTSQNGDPQLQHENIINLASIELTDVEKDILCRGLRFGIPPRIDKDHVFAEFELAWQQMPHDLITTEKEKECIANLSSIAHRFVATRIDRTGYPLRTQHMEAIKNLKKQQEDCNYTTR